MLEVGGYVALALVLVEVALIFFLIKDKTSVGLFSAASIAIFPFAAFFWMDNRVTKITIPKCPTQNRIGSVKHGLVA